jgi:lysine 6-dehydrogenase
MRVAVLGAGGTIAPAIVRDLAESGEVDELALLDLDLTRAEEVARTQGAGKARAARVDASAEAPGESSLASALEGVGALVNSAGYRVNLEAMRACLATGCHYIDLGGLYWMTKRQLELDPEFERAGLLAVLGTGSAPGKTNLMAAHGANALGLQPAPNPGTPGSGAEDVPGVSVDSIHVSAAGRDPDPPPGESFPYALRTLLDEATLAPIAVRDGRAVELEPLADGGEVDFGEPIGPASTIYTLHSETLTLPETYGAGEASFRLSLSPAVESRLRELVDADPGEVASVAAAAQRPSASTVSVHVVEVSGGGRRARVRSITEPQVDWGLGGGIVSTATPAAAAVRLLARGAVTARGARPPERCLDPGSMFAELEGRGVRFETEVTEEVQTR